MANSRLILPTSEESDKQVRSGIWSSLWAHFQSRTVESQLIIASALAFVIGAGGYAGAHTLTSTQNAQAFERSSDIYASASLLPLVRPSVNLEPSSSLGGAEINVADNTAFIAPHGPSAVSAESFVLPERDQISLYVVREGDTLSEIADSFGVSVSTIKWANDLPNASTVRVGQELIILPVSGVRHTVQKGETLSSIVDEYGGDMDEVLAFNGIDDPSLIGVGDEFIIPHGEFQSKSPAPAQHRSYAENTPSAPTGYYMRPVDGGRRTQGLHGYNAVDIATAYGASVYASAPGSVIISKGSGWNGGYGSYVVIKHPNGTQTLYSHLSSVIVGVGQDVVAGQVIGYVGNSGRSTGPHLHFEIRGGPTNPF
ncbi:MAG: M23 family metallopeptidase [Candidatus Paceibacterota bacterium]